MAFHHRSDKASDVLLDWVRSHPITEMAKKPPIDGLHSRSAMLGRKDHCVYGGVSGEEVRNLAFKLSVNGHSQWEDDQRTCAERCRMSALAVNRLALPAHFRFRCDRRHVPYKRVGKLIVATSEEQLDVLRGYQRQALRNGVGHLRWLDRDEALRLEPDLRCLAGIFSETTGVIDSHAFMLSLHGDVEAHGGIVSFHTQVTDLDRDNGRLLVRCGDFDLAAQMVVNAAGLEAPKVANALGGHWRSHYAKGHYYALSGGSPFTHLVYPVAEPGGLGVHVTLDMAGQARFGPDVVWIDEADYAFDRRNRDRFVEAIQKYYPGLDRDRLHPDYTGIRPKLAPAGGPATDFVIEGPADHGISGLVNLLGIESPGLTSSFAIAERVVRLLA